MDTTLNLIIFLVAVTLLSIVWGRITRWSVNSKHVTSLANYIMRYSRIGLEPIKAIIIWFTYLLTGLIGCLVPLVIFKVNIFSYFGIDPKFLIYIPLGIIAQMSLSSLILMLIATINTKIDWFSVIMNIPWVRIMVLMPWYVRLLYPLTGAFFEELFFRGTVFFVLVNVFPSTGLIFPIIVATVLFVVQQALNTESRTQGVAMSIGAIAISVSGCLLILVTGSFLPALLCHELYALLYLTIKQPTTYKNKIPNAASLNTTF